MEHGDHRRHAGEDRGDAGNVHPHRTPAVGFRGCCKSPVLQGWGRRVVTENGPLVDCLEKVVLGAEDEVDGLDGDTCTLGDRLHRCGLVADVAEQFVRLANDPATRCLRLRAAFGVRTVDSRHAEDFTSGYH